MLGKYSMKFCVTSFDVGPSRRLKYSMLLKLLQEAAGRQLDAEGMSYEFLRENGSIFLLTKVYAEIKDLPAVGDTVTAETWVRGLQGAQFVRNMRLSGGRGETLAEVRSLWITVNPESHRILRPSAFPFPELICWHEDDDVAVSQRRLSLPDNNIEYTGEYSRPVRWSDIDSNGHMNNAVYADIICDYFPGGLAASKLSAFSIFFLAEALEGSSIVIRAGMPAPGQAVFEGKIEGKRCFEAGAEVVS